MTVQALTAAEPDSIKIAKSNMSGGSGEDSYAKNSQSQAHVFNFCELLLYDALREVKEIPRPGAEVPALRLADLGCATGANTLNAVKSMLDLLKSRYEASGGEMPEVEVFFSDLPSNDFNHLFQELAPLQAGGSGVSLKDFCRDSDKRIYFAGGVPGSFFKERLFPSRSMHIISSFSALHWLSEVPAAVTDKASDAYNKNRIWFDGTDGKVRQVISEQSHADLTTFLRFRAEELVPGGILVLMFGGRLEKGPQTGGESTDGVEEFQGLNEAGELLQLSFQQLVAEKVIEADKLDSFNISAYSRSLAEMKAAVKESGKFDIHLLENVVKSDIIPEQEKQRLWPTPEAFGKSWANKTRSVTSGLLHSHLGPDLSEALFQRLQINATQNFHQYSKIRMCAIVAILVRR